MQKSLAEWLSKEGMGVLFVCLSGPEAVKNRTVSTNKGAATLGHHRQPLQRAFPASGQGCQSQVSLKTRRHLSWAGRVTSHTVAWATANLLL